MATADVLEIWAGGKKISQRVGAHAKSIARNLHDRAMGISDETHERGRAAEPFVANDPNLDSFALPGDNNERDQAAIGEMYELESLPWLVQAGVAREILETE